MKKELEPVSKTFKDVSEDVTTTLTESVKNKNKALENLNNKLSEIMNNRVIIATYFMSPLSKITNPEQTSQGKLVKDPDLKRVIGLLMNKTKLITLYDNLLTFRDRDKKFKLEGNLLKKITTKNYNVFFANLRDMKFLFEFAREMNFDETDLGNKSTRHKSLVTFFQSPNIMASASGVSMSSRFLSSNPIELCDRIKFLLQRRKA